MKKKFLALSIVFAIAVMGVMMGCSKSTEPITTDPVVTAIDLSGMDASVFGSVRFYDDANTYNFPFNVSAVIRFCTQAGENAGITTDGVPLLPGAVIEGGDDNGGNVLFEVMGSETTHVNGVIDWSLDTTKTEYKYQGDGVVTETWEYNAAEGAYVFTVDKSLFTYGVDSVIVASTYRPSGWGGAQDTGIAENTLPAQGAEGVGEVTFDTAYEGINLGTTVDSAVVWQEAVDVTADTFANVGIKNNADTFEIWVKGSFIVDGYIADITSATQWDDLWAALLIVMGKGTAPAIAPVFSPADGTTFPVDLDVSISQAEGDDILYTSTIDAYATTNLYSAPINITADTTFIAWATNATQEDSVEVTASYAMASPDPVLTASALCIAPAGTVDVTITAAGVDTIYWTTNAWTDTETYVGAISLDATATVESYTETAGVADSAIVSLTVNEATITFGLVDAGDSVLGGNPTVWAWDDDANYSGGDWASKPAMNDDGDGTYSISMYVPLTSTTLSIILHGDSAQTADIVIGDPSTIDGQDYTITATDAGTWAAM